jgi:hypothetical protein
MAIKFDIGDLERELATLISRADLKHVAFVVPLAPGMRDMASRALAEGPPFEPGDAGVDFHQVLLTDDEAVFVFGLEHGPESLERVLASEDFWSVVSWWEHIAAGRPRLAEVAYEWRATPR